MRILGLIFVVGAFLAPVQTFAKDKGQWFSVGYDFFTMAKALDKKSRNTIDYDQNDSGLTLGTGFELDNGDYLIFEFRDGGTGTIACLERNAVIEIDGEDWYCSDNVTVTEFESSSLSIAYEFQSNGLTNWRIGYGQSMISYLNSNIPENEQSGIYLGWSSPLSVETDGSGLYLDFASVYGQTAGIGVKWRFKTD